jgi:hypothetical protein
MISIRRCYYPSDGHSGLQSQMVGNVGTHYIDYSGVCGSYRICGYGMDI